jgi:hypothetical protein
MIGAISKARDTLTRSRPALLYRTGATLIGRRCMILLASPASQTSAYNSLRPLT